MYYALDREVVAENDLLYGELMDRFWSPPLSSPLYKQMDAAHTLLSYFPN